MLKILLVLYTCSTIQGGRYTMNSTVCSTSTQELSGVSLEECERLGDRIKERAGIDTTIRSSCVWIKGSQASK